MAITARTPTISISEKPQRHFVLGDVDEAQQPQWGCDLAVARWRNPVGVDNPAAGLRVARSSPGGIGTFSTLGPLEQFIPRGEQPWAGGHNPVGIAEVEYPKGIAPDGAGSFPSAFTIDMALLTELWATGWSENSFGV
jgi:hypothetical protein